MRQLINMSVTVADDDHELSENDEQDIQRRW